MSATQFNTGLADATGTTYVLQEAISAYTDEAYTDEKRLSGTGLVSSGHSGIDRNTETYIGQMRWRKPIGHVVNVADVSDASEGNKASYSTDFLKYVKTVRTHGAEKINVKEIITQEDGLAKIARDFSETRMRDEHKAIQGVLKGVALSEALNGAADGSGAAGLGGCAWGSDDTDKKYGFYVDLGDGTPLINKAGYESNGTTANMAYVGAQRAEGFLEAFGMAWKDYEPEWAYLVITPKIMASLRSANLVDQDRITEGNIDFQTIFNGKFRLITTRATMNFTAAELADINGGGGAADIGGKETSFIVLPGSIAMEPLAVPVPVEMDRNAAAHKGSGTTEVWYRWGYILAPVGYDWVGASNKFVADAEYYGVNHNGTVKDLATASTDTTGNMQNCTAVFDRKTTSSLSLGILPIFHS